MTQKLHVVGWLGMETVITPTQIRLRRICGPQRAPNGALVDGAMVELRVVLRVLGGFGREEGELFELGQN